MSYIFRNVEEKRRDHKFFVRTPMGALSINSIIEKDMMTLLSLVKLVSN